MATGQRPFAEVERSQLIGAILRRSPDPPLMLNPRLSPELERIIGKCLEKEPENRYQSAKEMSVDLRRLERFTEAGTPKTGARVGRPSRQASFPRGLLPLTSAVIVAVQWSRRPYGTNTSRGLFRQ
jgi:serine/threonine protein kinase